MATSVSARYGEAAHHKFPNASSNDILIIDRLDGQGPQLIFWNPAIGTQMTETEVTQELALIDAAVTELAAIKTDAATLLNLLKTGTKANITAYANNISILTILTLGADIKARLNEIYLLLAADKRD